jgi:hypothetical protein
MTGWSDQGEQTVGPDAATQIGWGFGTALAALVATLAFVPDPFFRQRVFAA